MILYIYIYSDKQSFACMYTNKILEILNRHIMFENPKKVQHMYIYYIHTESKIFLALYV